MCQIVTMCMLLISHFELGLIFFLENPTFMPAVHPPLVKARFSSIVRYPGDLMLTVKNLNNQNFV